MLKGDTVTIILILAACCLGIKHTVKTKDIMMPSLIDKKKKKKGLNSIENMHMFFYLDRSLAILTCAHMMIV